LSEEVGWRKNTVKAILKEVMKMAVKLQINNEMIIESLWSFENLLVLVG